MVRKFNIEISDYGWEIDIVDFEPPYSDYKEVMDAPISIGVCKKLNNKLIAMYDPFPPRDEAIEDIKEHKLFQEECIFIHLDKSFSGTFVDALIYIEKQYIEDKIPTLEELKSE